MAKKKKSHTKNELTGNAIVQQLSVICFKFHFLKKGTVKLKKVLDYSILFFT